MFVDLFNLLASSSENQKHASFCTETVKPQSEVAISEILNL